MTGLLNRKGFGDKGARIAAAASASGAQIAILSIQLNRFKTINDRFGYDVGDAVLRRLSSALEQDVPADAALARLSGGEFAVLVAIGEQQEALDLAERCCAARPLRSRSRASTSRSAPSSACRRRPRTAPAFPTCCAAPTSRWPMRAARGRRARCGSTAGWSAS
jgi:diguanylate cyclase (GGDEF)-like protein